MYGFGINYYTWSPLTLPVPTRPFDGDGAAAIATSAAIGAVEQLKSDGDLFTAKSTERDSAAAVKRVRYRYIRAVLAHKMVIDPEESKLKSFKFAIEDEASSVGLETRR
jgi:hypothetical protein